MPDNKPTYMIAHGSAAVQAARIIANVQAEQRRKRAEAYYMAAEWHDKQQASCLDIANDEPRIGAATRERAKVAATHHGASSAGLRLAATQLMRAVSKV